MYLKHYFPSYRILSLIHRKSNTNVQANIDLCTNDLASKTETLYLFILELFIHSL